MTQEEIDKFNERFRLSEEQIKKYLAWEESLPHVHFTADSNGIVFLFPSCSLGYLVSAKRREGEEIDLTEWEHF